MRPIPFPQIQTDYRQLAGGLDLVTPRIALDPGKVFDAQNYEPVTVGGYRRISGHERFDGTASPSAQTYWTIAATITGTLTLGATLTGATSGSTGRILGVFGTTVVLNRVVGTYQSGELLKVAGVTVATATTAAVLAGASSPSDNADWKLLSANDYRAGIGAVPGSGPVRGVFVLADKVYAFRDDAPGTSSFLYKATVGGWVQVDLGKELQFTAAVGQINNNAVITGATSGATAVVARALLRSGSWTSAGVGTLVLTSVTGTFVNGEAIQVGGVTKVTALGPSAAIYRAPGGYVETVASTFGGSLGSKRIYGCDGTTFGFEFDGTTYVPIRTGMIPDTPTHVTEFRNYLVFAFGSSIQLSGIGQPYAWTAVLGAAEIATSGDVTGFSQLASNQAGAALGIFTSERQYTMYGTSAANFVLMPSNYDMGFSAKSIQAVSNTTYGLTARGLQSVVTTLNYGDFEYAALSFFIQPLIAKKLGLSTASVTLHATNQYKVFFSDGTGLVVGLTGEKIAGLMPLNYGKTVRCMTSTTLSTGVEVCYFGSDDGYVYQDGVGTSFDGNPIEAWVRPAFNNLKSPRVRKSYKRAIVEASCEGFSKLNIGYDLGYGNPDAEPPAVQADQALLGAGGYWDQFTWDAFTWDTPLVNPVDLSIDGTETNISFLFYSNRAQDDSVTLQGIALLYAVRKLVHSGS